MVWLKRITVIASRRERDCEQAYPPARGGERGIPRRRHVAPVENGVISMQLGDSWPVGPPPLHIWPKCCTFLDRSDTVSRARTVTSLDGKELIMAGEVL